MPKKDIKKSTKRRKGKKATVNQRRVAQIVAEQVRKGEKVSVSAAMRKAGYSPSTASKPHKVTESKAWQELLDEYLPEEYLSTRHRELADAMTLKSFTLPDIPDEAIREMFSAGGIEVISINEYETKKGNTRKAVLLSIPESLTRARALELAYKIRGKMAPQVMEHRFANMDKDQLVQYIMTLMNDPDL